MVLLKFRATSFRCYYSGYCWKIPSFNFWKHKRGNFVCLEFYGKWNTYRNWIPNKWNWMNFSYWPTKTSIQTLLNTWGNMALMYSISKNPEGRVQRYRNHSTWQSNRTSNSNWRPGLLSDYFHSKSWIYRSYILATWFVFLSIPFLNNRRITYSWPWFATTFFYNCRKTKKQNSY